MRARVAALLGVAAMGAATPPPASLDAPGVDAWRRAHIDAAGWTLMHADGAALSYARPADSSLAPDKDGVVKVDVRREYYRPVRLGPQTSRSNYQVWLIDCEGRRLKVAAMSFYAQNNMKGSGFRKDGAESSWSAVPEGSQDSPLFDRICASQAPARP